MMLLYRRKHSARRVDRLTPDGAALPPGYAGWSIRLRPLQIQSTVSCRGRYGKHRRALFFLRGSSRAAAVFRPRLLPGRRHRRPRDGEHSLLLSRRSVVVVRHPYCYCVARTARRRKLLLDHKASARSGIVGYHAIWVGAGETVWAPLSYGPPKVMLAGLPFAAVGVWLLFWPGNRGPNRFGEKPG
jgi:hypothetical protein